MQTEATFFLFLEQHIKTPDTGKRPSSRIWARDELL
jgi:hypothetical protein